jgi:hypothetical protein
MKATTKTLFEFETMGEHLNLGSKQDAHRVGVSKASSPALHGDDGLPMFEQSILGCLGNGPHDTCIYVFLPWFCF